MWQRHGTQRFHKHHGLLQNAQLQQQPAHLCDKTCNQSMGGEITPAGGDTCRQKQKPPPPQQQCTVSTAQSFL